MKKGIILLLFTGVFFTSFGQKGKLEKKAAIEFCNCHEKLAELYKEASNAESASALLEIAADVNAVADEATACHKVWMKKYDGNIDVDRFKFEVKKVNTDVYDLAEEREFFGKE